MTSSKRLPWRTIAFSGKPKHFFLALFLVVFRLVALLPLSILLVLGRAFGNALHYFSAKLKHIAMVNIGMCFPNLSAIEIRRLTQASFRELGMAVFETLFIWFRDGNSHFKNKIRVKGGEYWQEALAQRRGVILLSCHSGSLDLNVCLLNTLDRAGREFAFTYRQPSDSVLDLFLQAARQPYADLFFPVGNLLGISRVLKNGGLVWYAPDIETSKKGRVFVKFMGVDAATPSAIGRLAETTKALVLPFRHSRDADGEYTLHFYPCLEGFPQKDLQKDTQTVNDKIAEMLTEKPETYWWVIKRFRYRRDGGDSVYKK